MLSATACESPPSQSPFALTVRAVFAALFAALLAVTVLHGPVAHAPAVPHIPVDSALAYAE
jgi:hypothetical protein